MNKLVLILLALFSGLAFGAEDDYVRLNCFGAVEYVLPDKTRVDCLTAAHAIEYDYCPKWAEAVGQSLHYSSWTGRRAGIMLICKDNESQHIKRLERLIQHYNLPIDMWTIKR